MTQVFLNADQDSPAANAIDANSGDQLTIGPSATISAEGGFSAIDAAVGVTNVEMQIYGTLYGDNAINIEDTGATGGDSILVAHTGNIIGEAAGIKNLSGDVSIVNEGSISGNSYGIAMSGSENTITNSGSITGGSNSAIWVDGTNDLIVNSGTIEAGLNGNGIQFAGTDVNDANVVYNSGVIGGAAHNANGFDWTAIESDVGYASVHNSGEIEGKIVLDGASGGVIHNSGTIDGFVFFGDGDSYLGNSGQLDVGVQFGNGDNEFSNSGRVNSQVSFGDGNDLVVNSGTLDGDLVFGNGNGSEVINSGHINSEIVFGTGANAVLNHGLMTYGIEFSGAASNYVANTGTIDGDIDFGSGNDAYHGARGIENGTVFGGDGNDALRGGDGENRLDGGLGADRLNGGADADVFVYGAAAESDGASHDTIAHFDANSDMFDLNVRVTVVDAALNTGTLSSGAHFDSALTTTFAHLRAHHAVLYTPSAGNEANHTFLIVDANGHAGYQAGADYVIELSHAASLAGLSADSFG